MCDCWPARRSFLKGAAALGAGLSGFALAAPFAFSDDADMKVIGPPLELFARKP